MIWLASHVFIRVVSFGIQDKHCGNVNIKLTLQSEVENEKVDKGLDIRLDNEKENEEELDLFNLKRSIKIEGDVKEILASKPIKHFLKNLQKHLSIGYDMLSGRLTMKYDGTDTEKLPPLKKDLLIYQNKIVDVTVNDQR